MTKSLVALLSVVAAASFTWSTSASAGIIVTVGKLSATAEQGDGDSNRKPAGRTSGGEISVTNAPLPNPDAAPGVDDSSDDSFGYEPVPKGFGGCGGVGGGRLYCDGDEGQAATGAGPGAGGGGELGDPGFDDDEIVVMGCGAGGSGGLPAALGLVVVLGLTLRRRWAAGPY